MAAAQSADAAGPDARGPADTAAEPGEGPDRHPHRPAAGGAAAAAQAAAQAKLAAAQQAAQQAADGRAAAARPAAARRWRRRRRRHRERPPAAPLGGRRRRTRRWRRPRPSSACPTSGAARRRASASTARASPPGPGARPGCRSPTTRGPRWPTARRCRSRTSSPVTCSSTVPAGATHVAMYVGGGAMIEAPYTGASVWITATGAAVRRRRPAVRRRRPGPSADEPTAAAVRTAGADTGRAA